MKFKSVYYFNSCSPIFLEEEKKKFVHWSKPRQKILAQEMDGKKNSCKLKMSYPSYHFSNGPSLKAVAWSVVKGVDKTTPSHQQES